MKTVALNLPDEVATEAEKLAAQKGLSLSEYVVLSVEEKLVRDENFHAAAQYILEKNAELYRRLA
jgi:hypothetical protein